MIIRPIDVQEVRPEGSPIVLKRLIHRDQHGDNISVTWVKLDGHHKKTVSDLCDRVYYIVEGDGEFQIGDEAPGKVTTGDFVFIPKGVPYVLDGQMSYLVINGPAFAPGADRVLE